MGIPSVMVAERLHEVRPGINGDGRYNDHPVPTSALRKTLLSIARLRCPRCHEGAAFRSLLDMHQACPVCGYVFEREPGYFVGSMYISYALAIPVYVALAGVLKLLLRGRSDLVVLALALPLFIPFAPFLFRYSRVIWMHLDLALDRKDT